MAADPRVRARGRGSHPQVARAQSPAIPRNAGTSPRRAPRTVRAVRSTAVAVGPTFRRERTRPHVLSKRQPPLRRRTRGTTTRDRRVKELLGAMNFAEEVPADIPPVPVRTRKVKKCPHGRRKDQCRDRNGSSICIHNRRRDNCATCNYYTCYGCSCVYKGHRFCSKSAL